MKTPQNGFNVRMKGEDVVELQMYGVILDGTSPWWEIQQHHHGVPESLFFFCLLPILPPKKT